MRICTLFPINISVIPLEPTDIHPDMNLPQLNFDQFLHVSNVHQEMLTNVQQIHAAKKIDQQNEITIVNKLVSSNIYTKAINAMTRLAGMESF